MPDDFGGEPIGDEFGGVAIEEPLPVPPQDTTPPEYTDAQRESILNAPALGAAISDQDLRNRLPGTKVYNQTPQTQSEADLAANQEIWRNTVRGGIEQLTPSPETAQSWFGTTLKPPPGQQMDPTAQLARGVVKGGLETVGGLVEDPENIPLLMAGALPGKAGTIATGAFMAQMLKGAPELYGEVKDALASGDTQREAEALTKAIASIGFFGAMGAHVKGGVSKFLESTTPEARARIYEQLKPKEENAIHPETETPVRSLRAQPLEGVQQVPVEGTIPQDATRGSQAAETQAPVQPAEAKGSETPLTPEEQGLVDQAVSANKERGTPVNLDISHAADDVNVASYDSDTGKVTVNVPNLRDALSKIPEKSRADYMDSLFNEEGVHKIYVDALGADLPAYAWEGLSGTEKKLFQRSYYGKNKGAELNPEQWGHEYLRRLQQWSLKVTPTEIARAKGRFPEWITQHGIDAALKGIDKARKVLNTEQSKTIGWMLDQSAHNLEFAKAQLKLGSQVEKKYDLRDRLNRLISEDRKRILDEGQGQEILNTAEDEGRKPKDIADDFFKNVYPTLDGPAKVRMDKFLKANTGFTPGEVTPREWNDIIMDAVDANEIHQLQGTARGLVAIMEFGNKRSIVPESRRLGSQVEKVSEENPKDLIDKVGRMSPTEFADWSKTAKGGFTTEAYRLGDAVDSQSMADHLKAESDRLNAEGMAALRERTMEGINRGSALVSQAQFFKEAWQRTTGVGSGGEMAIKEGKTPKWSAEPKPESVKLGSLKEEAKKIAVRLNNKRQAIRTLWRGGRVGKDMAQLMDAADNEAVNVAEQVRKGLDIGAPKPDQNAASAIIASGFDRTKLQNLRNTVANGADGPMKKTALESIDKALAQFQRLEPLARRGSREFDNQLADENANGINTESHEDYLPGIYDQDLWMGSKTPFVVGGGGSGMGTGFKKGKTFANPFEAVAAGYVPKSLSLSELAEHRIRAGQRLINRKQWAEGLKQVNDPTDGKPVATDLIRKTRPNGTSYEVAPPGYSSLEIIPGVRTAIHNVYAPVFKALTGESIINSNPVGHYVLEGVGGIKHGLLAFDTFHASRMMQKQAVLEGRVGWKKGISLLEYADKDLARAVAAGEITPEIAQWVRQQRPYHQLAIKNGLNVGRIAEAMYTSVARSLPGIGHFNKWVFEKVTRGAMMESFIHEVKRLEAANPEQSRQDIARKVARDLNVYYGNLGRQGFFRSKSFQDMARIVSLAPQWFEAMGRNEAKGFSQLAKGLTYDPVVHRTLTLGTLGKAMGQGLLAYFIGTQLVNLATRGQPTWKNEEEGHKMDAWIPSLDGKGNGFFLSPLAIPAELTHDMLKYSKKEGNALKAGARILSNKASSLVRAGSALLTGKAFYTDTATDGAWNRIKKAAWSLNPTPIPLQTTEKVSYPGQAQRQITASLGIKTEPAESAQQQINAKAQKFLESKGKKRFAPQVNEEEPSFSKLRFAIRKGDDKEAIRIMSELEQTHKPNKILETMRNQVRHPFTGSTAAETKFKATLSEKERQLYQKAKEERKQEFQDFLKVWRDHRQAPKATPAPTRDEFGGVLAE